MTKDTLLEALAKAAKEQAVQEAARFDDRWDRLSRGELNDEELDALRAEASGSPELEAALEAFAPLSTGFRARVTDAILNELGAVADEPAPPSADNVVALPRRARKTWMPVALAASVLAAVALGLILRPGMKEVMLPGYAYSLQGTTKTLRGVDEPATGNLFTTGNRFRLLLTPETTVEGTVEARIYSVQARQVMPVPTPAPRVSTDGAVLIEGTVGTDVLLPVGAASLIIAVGGEDELPDATTLQYLLQATDTVKEDSWTAWKLEIHTE